LRTEVRFGKPANHPNNATGPPGLGEARWRKRKLDEHQQKEARKRLLAGRESCRTIAKSYKVHTRP